jgi:hypothetical protein
MKAQDLSAGLLALAPLADRSGIEEIRSFASLFSHGKGETVGARLKQFPEGYGLPSSLKTSLAAVETMLHISGAKKQAADIRAVLAKFSGAFDRTTDELVAQIRTAVASRPSRTSASKRAAPTADQTLARQLADDLTRTVFDSSAFSKIVERLNNSKQISTPTLAMTGNIFLGNSKEYKGRKPVIADILKRQGEELLDNSRRAAVKRAG